MSIVMGVDQHRAQITAEWIDLVRGEISRARVSPADRVACAGSLSGSRASSWRSRSRRRPAGGSCRGAAGGRRGGASRRAGGDRGAAREQEAREDRPCGRPSSPRAADGRAAAGVVDPARSHPRSARPGEAASHADRAALRVAAADPGGALSPWLPAAAPADEGRRPRLARGAGAARGRAPADHGRRWR